MVARRLVATFAAALASALAVPAQSAVGQAAPGGTGAIAPDGGRTKGQGQKGPKEGPAERGAREWAEFGDRMKPLLEVGDPEWVELAPRIERVLTLRREVGTDRAPTKAFGPLPKPAKPGKALKKGAAAPDGTPPPDGQGPLQRLPVLPNVPSPRAAEPSEARVALNDAAKAVLAGVAERVPSADLRSRLALYRQARERAGRELTKAEQDLRDLLTYRQEVLLVMMGVLD
ncbi:MAG: hypothetical protein JWO31_2370 [Phycisphaerales bacterium]|nr:hypothetical protein [Phycisphaerales bacterium]